MARPSIAGSNPAAIAKRNAVVEQHMDLVRMVAKRASKMLPMDLEDLIQQGMLGLIEAADRYDASDPKVFRVKARKRILGSMIQVNRRSHYRNQTNQALEAMEITSVEEIAQVPSHEAQVAALERNERLFKVIEVLPDRQRTIVELYYQQDLTNEQIGKHIGGVKATRTGVLHRGALVELRRECHRRNFERAA
jgi:RNA polymerase sigma factor (sigma-70 family)